MLVQEAYKTCHGTRYKSFTHSHSLFSLLLDFLLATEALEDETGFADDVDRL